MTAGNKHSLGGPRITLLQYLIRYIDMCSLASLASLARSLAHKTSGEQIHTHAYIYIPAEMWISNKEARSLAVARMKIKSQHQSEGGLDGGPPRNGFEDLCSEDDL